jgi:hypothetical protein
MHKPIKSVRVAWLMIVTAVVSTVLSAQIQEPNPGKFVTSTAEGRVLWQYNTHG